MGRRDDGPENHETWLDERLLPCGLPSNAGGSLRTSGGHGHWQCHGKLAAVVIGVGDLEALEEFEMAQDLAAYREAKAADDGGRVSLDELRRGLAQ